MSRYRQSYSHYMKLREQTVEPVHLSHWSSMLNCLCDAQNVLHAILSKFRYVRTSLEKMTDRP